MLTTLANLTHFKCSQQFHEGTRSTGAYSTVFLKPEVKPSTLFSTAGYLEKGAEFENCLSPFGMAEEVW